MRRFIFLLLLSLFFSFAATDFALADQVTLTTYYPSPFGAYDRLRLVPRAILAGACDVGSLYVRNSDNVLQYCALVGGVGTWGPITGFWSLTTQNPGFNSDNALATIDQYYLNTSYPNLSNRQPLLGLGTQNPLRAFHIVVNNTSPETIVALENQSTAANNGAIISFRGTSTGTPNVTFQDFVHLRALYEDHAALTMKSSLGFFLRDGAGNSAEQLHLSGNGYLGLRDSTPDAVLEIVGNATALLPNSDPYLMISSQAANDGNVLIVNSQGKVGIGTITPNEMLEVNGNVRASGLYLGSDARLKKNIQTVDHALDKISRLNGVSFEWKTDKAPTPKEHMGVIAQDVEKVFPDLVNSNSGTKSVDYPALIAPLIEAVKELKKQNEAQEKMMQNQQVQIKALQNALNNK